MPKSKGRVLYLVPFPATELSDLVQPLMGQPYKSVTKTILA